MCVFSLLYHRDIDSTLGAVIDFRVGGHGGGAWHVDVSPEVAKLGEGVAQPSRLMLHLRETDDFCRIPTGRFNLPLALVGGRLRLRGDQHLSLRMSKLLSVDARP